MSSVNFITLKDYARITGQTEQQAREQLQAPELRRYLLDRNGKLLVDARIMHRLKDRQTGSSSKASESSVEKDKEPAHEAPAEHAAAPEQPGQAEAMAALREQLQQQAREIAALREQLQEKDRVILDYAGKFAEMAAQAQGIAAAALKTTGQAQYLQAAAQAQEQPAGQEEAAEVIQDTAAPEPPAEIIQDTQDTGAAQEKKRSFWSWLLRRQEEAALELLEKEPLPECCQECQEPDCWECDNAGERWQLAPIDQLKTERALHYWAMVRHAEKVVELDRQLAELGVIVND